MDTKQGVLDILNDLTGEDLSDQMDENIFDNGLMDSMASVQMLLSLQEKFDIDVITKITGLRKEQFMK